MLSVQSHYTWLLGLLANPIKRSCCMLLSLVMFNNVSRGRDEDMLNSLSVRVQRFMSI